MAGATANIQGAGRVNALAALQATPDPLGCVVDSRNQLDCRTGATGTSIRLIIGQLAQAHEMLGQVAASQ